MGHLEASKTGKLGDKWLGATVVVLCLSLVAFGVGAYFAVDGSF